MFSYNCGGFNCFYIDNLQQEKDVEWTSIEKKKADIGCALNWQIFLVTVMFDVKKQGEHTKKKIMRARGGNLHILVMVVVAIFFIDLSGNVPNDMK